MIRQIHNKWVLFSKDGSKKLGEFDSKEAAQKHEQQIRFFKDKKQIKKFFKLK